MKRLSLALFLIGILFSCGTAERKNTKKLRELITQRKFDEALSLVKSKEFHKDEESRLLLFMERGMIHHLRSEYFQSLQNFDQAKALSDKLFTISISKKITSAITNESVDNYYGARYERSAIRFYQALNHLMISRQGFYEEYLNLDKKVERKELNNKEKRSHLQSARAVVIEWDSLLDSYKKETKGDAVFKDDLLVKLFGALIHEQMGSRSEINIAKQLYKDAKKLLYRYYNYYPSFNKSYKLFKKEFKNLSTYKQKKIQTEYIKSTSYTKNLLFYIDNRLKKLKSRKNNVHLLIMEGLVNAKAPKRYDFPIGFNTLPFGINAANKRDFTSYVRKSLALSSLGRPTVSFELPSLKFSVNSKRPRIIVKNSKGQKISETSLVLINPVSEIAYSSLNEGIGDLKQKVGIRVATKQLASLATSFLAYRSSAKKGGDDLFSSALGAGMFLIANKVIKESERADLRQWTTLPHNIWMSSLIVPTGVNKIFIKSGEWEKELIQVSIKNSKNLEMLRFNIAKLP